MHLFNFFCFSLLIMNCSTSVNAATSNKFRIVLNTSRTKYDDAAMHCLQRNSTLVDSSNNMKEILQLLIFAQNIDNPGPVNVTIWLKENTTSNVQSSPSILRLEYQYGENNISVGNEEYLNISTDTTNAQPNDLHSFACKEDIESCPFLTQDKLNSNVTDAPKNCSCDDIASLSQNTCKRFQIPTPETSTVLPPPISCEASDAIDGFTFPTTFLHSNAISNQTCDTHNETASISCVAIGSGLASFDKSTLLIIPCNTSLDDLQAKLTNTSDLPNLDKVIGEFQAIIFRNTTSASNNVVEVAETLHRIAEAAIQNDIQISSNTFQSVLSIVSAVSQHNRNESAPQRSDLVQSVETLVSRIAVGETGKPVNIRTRSIEVQVNRINFTSAEEILNLPNIDEAGLEDLNSVNITLPVRSLSSQFSNENVAVIIYKNGALLPYKNDPPQTIVGIVIGNHSRISLDEDAAIEFKEYNSTRGKSPRSNQETLIETVKFVDKRCAYWNFTLSSWKFDGCVLDTSSDVAICKCDHLTNFAVLISIYDVPSDVALNAATTVACSVMLVALFITVVYHLSNEKLRQSIPGKIQINIFCNLFVAYLFFVVGIGRVNMFMVCNIVTGVLHFTFLTSFFWMSVYCHSIYRSTHDVFIGQSSQYIWKAALFAYGFPALIVAFNILLAIFYLDASNEYDFLADVVRPKSKYFHDSACWVNKESLYYSFLSIVGLNLLYNLVIVILVSKRAILKEAKDIRSTKKRKSNSKKAFLIFSMSFTVGLNWVLGYFLLIYPDPLYQKIVAWVFTFVTCVQGTFILYFSCIKRVMASCRLELQSVVVGPLKWKSFGTKDTLVSSNLASKEETSFTNKINLKIDDDKNSTEQFNSEK